MSNFVGKPFLIFQYFSLKSHGFINIHEYYKIIICISDHFVNIICLGKFGTLGLSAIEI